MKKSCFAVEQIFLLQSTIFLGARARRLGGASRITKSFSPASLSLSGFYLPSESRRNNTGRISLRIFLSHPQPSRDTAGTPLNDYIVKIHATAPRGGFLVKVAPVYVTRVWMFQAVFSWLDIFTQQSGLSHSVEYIPRCLRKFFHQLYSLLSNLCNLMRSGVALLFPRQRQS